MPHAIHIYSPGGADALRWESIPTPTPGPGEVLIRQTAIGVNFIDIYHRTGLYPVAARPFTPGMEGCGIIEARGEGATNFEIGDRVAYGGGPIGAYAEYRVIPESVLVKLPDFISDAEAASVMLKGLTAHYLLRRTYMVAKGTSLLLHVAAGGVGSLMCQWAHHLEAEVIGTAGSPEKAEIARANGCTHPIVYTQEDFVQRTKEITGGLGVHVVYDSVGQATFFRSLDCLRPLGLMVSFGQSSGPVPPFDISLLSQKGSLFLTRPTLMTYKANYKELVVSCAELFELMARKILRTHIHKTYPLRDAAQAHRDLESRQTHGAIVLIPGQ